LEAAAQGADTTEVKALLDGAAADVRGLSALVSLTEALDAARTCTEVPSLLLSWARCYLPATGVRLRDDRAVLDQVVARNSPGMSLVVVPAPPDPRTSIEFDVANLFPGTSGVPTSVLRLLAVAGRLIGSGLARLGRLERLEKEKESLRSLAVGSARSFLGESDAAKTVTKLVSRLASSDVVALLEGETGVGKTFVARLIHEAGARANFALLVINCAAIPENLVESELFGHERGAFTGASSQRTGVFESAAHGTVLLDEIGELPLASQAKLLHVFDAKAFSRVGSTRSLPLTARVLAATNRNLSEMVEEGTFRRDLFFRVSAVRLRIPPLRERRDDLALLAHHILRDLLASTPYRVDGFAAEALDVIRRYQWPGNVRELRNVIEHALVLGEGGPISVSDLPEALRAGASADRSTAKDVEPYGLGVSSRRVVELPASLDWLEKQAIEAALAATGGNRKQAAAILGINRVTLYKKLRTEAPG
jgi:DNA-binding NtrC family response regulator